MLRTLFILLAALLLLPAQASAESPTEYRTALLNTLRAAEAAVSTNKANASLSEYEPLNLALQRLEAIESVNTDDGNVVVIDNHSIINRFRGSRDEGRQAYNNLRQLVRAIDAGNQKVDWTKDANASSALNEVLKQSEFRGADGNPIGKFLDDLRSRLFRWLEEVFPGFSLPPLPFDLKGPVGAITWLITGAFVIFALVFFAFTWRSSRQNLARYAAIKAGQIMEREDSQTAMIAAQRAADEGNYRLAIHYLYLWVILHLAEKSRLRYDRSLTNREQLRAVASEGEIKDLLQKAVDAFDQIWYGHSPCTELDYGRFRSTVERILEATA